jgi:hypothetical protein
VCNVRVTDVTGLERHVAEGIVVRLLLFGARERWQVNVGRPYHVVLKTMRLSRTTKNRDGRWRAICSWERWLDGVIVPGRKIVIGYLEARDVSVVDDVSVGGAQNGSFSTHWSIVDFDQVHGCCLRKHRWNGANDENLVLCREKASTTNGMWLGKRRSALKWKDCAWEP